MKSNIKLCFVGMVLTLLSGATVNAGGIERMSFGKQDGCWRGTASNGTTYDLQLKDQKTFIFVRAGEIGGSLPELSLQGAIEPLTKYPGRTDLVSTYVMSGAYKLTAATAAPLLVCVRLENSFSDPEKRQPSPNVLPRDVQSADKQAARPNDGVSVDTDIAEREDIELMGLPTPVAKAIMAWQKTCRQEKDVTSQFTSDFITSVDIDGDGKNDFVLNGDEKSCINVKTGETTASGGGNGGTSLQVFLSHDRRTTGREFWVQSATIARFKGFGILDVNGNDGRAAYRLQNGKFAAASSSPSGGTQVFTLGR